MRSVVDVAFQEPALGVLDVDHPLPRRPQLVDPCAQLGVPAFELGPEPGPAQDRSRLGREPGEQSFLDRGEPDLLVLLHDEDAEQLSAVPHRQRPTAGHVALSLARLLGGGLPGGVRRPGGRKGRPVAHHEPHL